MEVGLEILEAPDEHIFDILGTESTGGGFGGYAEEPPETFPIDVYKSVGLFECLV